MPSTEGSSAETSITLESGMISHVGNTRIAKLNAAGLHTLQDLCRWNKRDGVPDGFTAEQMIRVRTRSRAVLTRMGLPAPKRPWGVGRPRKKGRKVFTTTLKGRKLSLDGVHLPDVGPTKRDYLLQAGYDDLLKVARFDGRDQEVPNGFSLESMATLRDHARRLIRRMDGTGPAREWHRRQIRSGSFRLFKDAKGYVWSQKKHQDMLAIGARPVYEVHNEADAVFDAKKSRRL